MTETPTRSIKSNDIRPGAVIMMGGWADLLVTEAETLTDGSVKITVHTDDRYFLPKNYAVIEVLI